MSEYKKDPNLLLQDMKNARITSFKSYHILCTEEEGTILWLETLHPFYNKLEDIIKNETNIDINSK